MKIFKSTKKYHEWLRQNMDVIEADLALKAELLARDPFTFLRGTFYRWMQVIPDLCDKAWNAPVVLSVGDLHAANFGTWRNSKDELIWGINDFDEAAYLPYTQDLIRLATSVELAAEGEELKSTLIEACDAILDGYREGLEKGGKRFIIDGDREWLEEAYGRSERSAEKFWQKLNQLPDLDKEAPLDVRTLLERSLPSKGMGYRIVHRQAGVGSLGRPRYTALAEWQGGFVAREVKALIPSAALWAQEKLGVHEVYYEEVLNRAEREPDPTLKVYEEWVVRGLAPDRRRIELSELEPEHDEERMLRAMGTETANIHVGTPLMVMKILDDLKDRKKDWLVKEATKMALAMREDWEIWKTG